MNFANNGALIENGVDIFGSQETKPYTYMGMSFMDGVMSSQNVTSTESTICQGYDVLRDITDHYSAMNYGMNTENTLLDDFSQHYMPGSYSSQYSLANEGMIANMKDEIGEFSDASACSSSKLNLSNSKEINGGSISEVFMTDYSDVKGLNFTYEGNMSSVSGNSSSDAENCTPSYISSKEQATYPKDEVTDELMAPSSHSFEAFDEAYNFFVDRDLNQSFGNLHSTSSQKHNHIKYEKEDIIIASKRSRHSPDSANEISSEADIDGGYLSLSASELYFPGVQPSTSSKMLFDCIKDESEGKMVGSKSMGSNFSEVWTDLNCKDFSDKSHVEDDSDICIIEDMSHPPPTNRSLANGNSIITSQPSTFSNSLHYTGVGGTRLKTRDERLVLQVALQVSSVSLDYQFCLLLVALEYGVTGEA